MSVFGSILSLFGVIMLYDARQITRKWFSFGDQNEASLGLKMIGLSVALVGGLILFFYL